MEIKKINKPVELNETIQRANAFLNEENDDLLVTTAKDGIELKFLGEAVAPPIGAKDGDVYRDPNMGAVYVFKGGSWVLLVKDGVNGVNGVGGGGLGINDVRNTIRGWTMVGATSATAGLAGSMPAPAAGDQEKFLQGDGTWTSASLSTEEDIQDFVAAVLSAGPNIEITYDDFNGSLEISGVALKSGTGITDAAGIASINYTGFSTTPSINITISAVSPAVPTYSGATTTSAAIGTWDMTGATTPNVAFSWIATEA